MSSNVRANMCDCCKEIWNQQSLKRFPLGKYELNLCPECAAEYEHVSGQMTNGKRIESVFPGGTKAHGTKKMYYSLYPNLQIETTIEWWNTIYKKGV